jgi:hypothetical protein
MNSSFFLKSIPIVKELNDSKNIQFDNDLSMVQLLIHQISIDYSNRDNNNRMYKFLIDNLMQKLNRSFIIGRFIIEIFEQK